MSNFKDIGTYPFSAIGEKLYYEFKNHGFRPTRKTLGYCAAKVLQLFLFIKNFKSTLIKPFS